MNLWYFKLRLSYVSEFIVWNIKGQRSMAWSCKNTRIRKSEYVAKTISFPNSCGNLRVAYYSDFVNFSSDYISGKFPKCLGIWEISEIGIWGIPQISLLPIGVWVHLKDLEISQIDFLKLKNRTLSDSLRNFGNFPDSQAFWEFPRFPGILGIYDFDHFLNFCHSLPKGWKIGYKSKK